MLFGLLYAAEPDDSLAASFLWVHAGTEVVFDVHPEVRFDFVGEVAASLLRAEEAGPS
jgi:hypothetical protein